MIDISTPVHDFISCHVYVGNWKLWVIIYYKTNLENRRSATSYNIANRKIKLGEKSVILKLKYRGVKWEL